MTWKVWRFRQAGAYRLQHNGARFDRERRNRIVLHKIPAPLVTHSIRATLRKFLKMTANA